MEDKKKEIFKVDDMVEIENHMPLPGFAVAPPLMKGEVKKVIGIFIDSAGNQHLDLGLKSEYDVIRSYETKETLPNCKVIHWVHPSRVKLFEF